MPAPNAPTGAAAAEVHKEPGEAGPSSPSGTEATEAGEEELLNAVDEGDVVQMVPCALLDGAELVELDGEGRATGPYLALDASLASTATGGIAGASGLYYYAPYGGEIDALDPASSSKPFLTGIDGYPSQAMVANSSAVVVAPLEANAGSGEAAERSESPEEKKTPKEKTIARVVMAVACTLLTLCIILVGVTLSMSEHINNKVREIHGPEKTEQYHVAERNATSTLPASSR